MLVKICGLREQEHVQAAVAAGADAVGFVFADSVRRIEPADAAAIAANVPAHVKRVAVMLHPSNDDWQRVLRDFSPDVLQTDAEDFAGLDVPDNVERWPVYRQGSAMVVNTSTFLYEGANSGQGETVDWSQAAEVATRGRMILAGGISAANVAEAVAIAKPFGVDVSSGVESVRGQKNSTLIRQFINAARAAEQTT